MLKRELRVGMLIAYTKVSRPKHDCVPRKTMILEVYNWMNVRREDGSVDSFRKMEGKKGIAVAFYDPETDTWEPGVVHLQGIFSNWRDFRVELRRFHQSQRQWGRVIKAVHGEGKERFVRVKKRFKDLGVQVSGDISEKWDIPVSLSLGESERLLDLIDACGITSIVLREKRKELNIRRKIELAESRIEMSTRELDEELFSGERYSRELDTHDLSKATATIKHQVAAIYSLLKYQRLLLTETDK